LKICRRLLLAYQVIQTTLDFWHALSCHKSADTKGAQKFVVTAFQPQSSYQVQTLNARELLMM